jgi:hypothetical protein
MGGNGLATGGITLGIIGIVGAFVFWSFVASVNHAVNEVSSAINGSAAPVGPRLYPGRIDAQPKDQERAIGQSATIDGVAATTTSASFRQSLSDFEQDGYIVVNVTLRNGGTKAAPYNPFDWRIQSPSGQVLDPTGTGMEGQLESGDLVQGGTVSGAIAFKIGATKGQFYILWKPNPVEANRGVWGFQNFG